jgi:hypothetical protein
VVDPAPAPRVEGVAAIDDRLATVVVRGERLRLRDVGDVPCDEVELLRDAIYARHGYVFRDAARNASFEGRFWYAPEVGLGAAEVVDVLTPRDRYNLDLLEARGDVCGR